MYQTETVTPQPDGSPWADVVDDKFVTIGAAIKSLVEIGWEDEPTKNARCSLRVVRETDGAVVAVGMYVRDELWFMVDPFTDEPVTIGEPVRRFRKVETEDSYTFMEYR